MGALPTVLRVLTRLNIGGPSRHAVILHRGLAELGWECVLARGASEGEEGDFTEWEPVDTVRVAGLRRGASPAQAAIAVRSLRRLIREVDPDIVHTHMAMAGFAARIAASGSRARVIHTFHGHVLEGYFSPVRERLYAVVERRLARRTDALIAVSAGVRDELSALGIGAPERWHVIPLGLDLDRLLAMDTPPPRTNTVGIVGRLVPIKDHATLLLALTLLPDGVRLVVAGDGELRTQLELFARELGLGGRVEFRGWVRDLASLYGELDVVVLSSINEGTPVAIIEAMAAGRPVVATAVGGVPDVVAPGVTGTLVPPADPAALAAAIAAALTGDALARQRTEQARAMVAGRFGQRRLVRDIEHLYARLSGE